MATSIAEAILQAANTLRKAGVPDARREAGSLLMHVLDCDRSYILAHAEERITSEQSESYHEFVAARSGGKPLQYITGSQEFFGLEFIVNTEVLIPRPETELLVEASLKLISQIGAPVICDVGTGSGCIIISLLKNLPQARACALDISPAALAIAKENAVRHQVEERLELMRSDCFSTLDPDRGPTFDLIVSNPPYVAERAFDGLQREVRDFEPVVALTAGPDGLDMIKRILLESPQFLKTNGFLIFEIGFDQQQAVRELIDEKIWKLVDIYDDLQGIPRTVALKKSPETSS